MIEKPLMTPAVRRFAEAARIGSRGFGYSYPDFFLYAGREIGKADRMAVAQVLNDAAANCSDDALVQFWFETQTWVVKPVRPYTLEVAELLREGRSPGPSPL